MIHSILNALFGKAEEINGHERCPTYLYRWPIFKMRSGVAAYIHHFVADDWSLDLHDHPKRFVTIGLRGAYYEEGPIGGRWYRAPWIRTFPATHMHRIKVPSQGCWTLVFVGRTRRAWGFWQGVHWIPWIEYVEGDEARKSCP